MSVKISEEQLIKLRNEIKMAEKLNKQLLEPRIRESIQRYIGSYIPPIGTDWDILINEIYPIVQFNLPSIFFRNPRVFLKPRNRTFFKKERDPITGKMVEVEADSVKSANTQENIINYDLVEIKYKEQVRRVLLDALLFPYGILWHGYKGEFGMTEEQSFNIKSEKVFVKRIPPLRFLKDPSVTVSDIDEGKWVARIIDVPLQDLKEDDKLDVDKNLKGFEGFTQTVYDKSEILRGGQDSTIVSGYTDPLINATDPQYRARQLAQFVKVYEVFLRPTKKEARNGETGKIVLLTDEQLKPLRVNSWDIKAEGFPAKILEFNPVPDRMIGLSDIDIYKNIADMKNIIRNLQLRNAQQNSKVYVGISKEEQTEEDIQRIQNGDQTIILFNDTDKPVRDRLTVASAGGSASSELYLIDQRLQRELEDKSGVSDLKKGFLQSGEESATSVKIRNAGSAARPAYRQDIMADFLKESVHYLLQLEKQFLTIKDAVRIVGSLDLEWSEKPTKADIQADTDVDIDVISMLPENPERELAELNQILQMMLQGLTIPEVRAQLAKEGKTIELAPLIEQIMLRLKIRDPNIFRNIKPEESEGFASIQQLRQAEANVFAAVTGQQVPFPPAQTDDHRVKLEIYSAISQMLKLQGQVSEMLEALIQTQQALMVAQEEEQAKPGTKLNKPSVQMVS